ncbi:hypothetical protein BGZ89_001338 [Linnemannia elongata]|nr:hypothetical protein BGZ89_001338 [Linnemannia elongata]
MGRLDWFVHFLFAHFFFVSRVDAIKGGMKIKDLFEAYKDIVAALPSPQQLGVDADSAQPDPEPADHATAAVEPSTTLGFASQPVQVILQPRSPLISPDVVTAVATAKDVDDEIDMDVEAGVPYEDDM